MTAPTVATTNGPVPAAGQSAPDFTLPSTAGEKVTLSSLRGRPVLLAFFPAAFTSVCTEELCEMRDDYDAFAAKGVAVLPISVDAVPSLREYKAKYGMKVDLLSDFFRDASHKYGVLNVERFNSMRSYFLVDREGVLRWAHVEEHGGHRRSDAELLAEVAKLD